MNSRKVVSLIIFIGGFTLILFGGIYNPYSQPVSLAPGNYVAYSFHMKANETREFVFESLDVFTIYIANETGYQAAMEDGNFTACYYTASGKYIAIKFTAPKDGDYYVLIANFNTKGDAEITFSYGRKEMENLIILGSLLSVLSLALLLLSIRRDKERPKYDSRCPYCGAPINSSWNYCPRCRYPLGGDRQ